MKLSHLCSIVLVAVGFAEASGNNRKRSIQRTGTPQPTEQSQQDIEDPSTQRQRISRVTSASTASASTAAAAPIPAPAPTLRPPPPLVLSASLENIFEHALNMVTARTPAESGIEINIHLHNLSNSIDPIPIFIRTVLRRIFHGNRVITQNEVGSWDLKIDANLAETKLFGFLMGLALKHQFPFTVRFSPMLYQVMAGRMDQESLMGVLRNTDPFMFFSLNNLRSLSEEDLALAELNFEDLGLPKEPVNRENVNRYILLKVKSILYYPRAQVLASFLNGVKLVIPIPLIKEQFNPQQLASIHYAPPDYTAAELRQCFEPIQDYEHYAEQYEWFFTAVHNMTRERRSKLLMFFTSNHHLPEYNAHFNIYFVPPRQPGGRSRPIGSPCIRQLLLSPAENYEQMVEDLELITNPDIDSSSYFYL